MPRSLSNLLTLILAFIGGAVGMLLTVEHYTHIDIGCTKTGEGCATTLSSAYGHVGPIPTALFGLGMYVAIAGLCFARGKQLGLEREREAQRAAAYAVSAAGHESVEERLEETQEERPYAGLATAGLHTRDAQTAYVPGLSVRRLDLMVWVIALMGFGISMWLQYVAIYQLQSFCKYCFTSAVLITLIFALASRDHLLDGRRLTGEQKMIGFVLGFIAILGGFIIVPDILAVVNKPKPPIDPTPKVKSAVTRDIVVSSAMHVKGDANAKYTLLEFADYQCKHCALSAPSVDRALKTYPKDIRIAFRNFPLPMHKWGRQAAAAAEAADKQGKFWEMHDLLFQHQPDIDSPTFEEAEFDKYAAELKLNVAKFSADRNSTEIKQRVQADVDAGEKARVDTTPTFFFLSPDKVTQFAGKEEMEKFMMNFKSDLSK